MLGLGKVMFMANHDFIRFGPWPGGLNNRDNNYGIMPTSELRFVKNWDVNDAGFLTPRLGTRKCGSAAMYTNAVTGAGAHFTALGSDEVTSGFKYAVVGVFRGTAANNFDLYYSKKPEDIAAWTLVQNGPIVGEYTQVLQYGNQHYLVPKPGSTAIGGKSKASLANGVAWVNIPQMPKGDIAFILRDRMFIIDKANARVYYSKVTDPTIWNAPDGGFFDVSPGDYDSGVQDAVFLNNLVYIFKLNSSYVFSFDTDPGIDGRVTPISKDLGAYCAVVYQNVIYVVNRRSVYKLANNYFLDIGKKLELTSYGGLDAADRVNNTFINIEGKNLLVGPFTSGLYTHFVMNISTGAWSGRLYTDLYTQPTGKAIDFVDSVAFTFGGVGKIYCPNKNDGTKDYVSYTRVRSTFGDQTASMDVDKFDHTISPEYSLATSDYLGRDYNEWKRLFYVTTRFDWDYKATGDDVLNLIVADTSLNNLETKATNIANTKGDKLDFTSRRFQAMTLKVSKAAKDLVALDPNTSSYLVFREIVAYTEQGGKVITS
jgi:hypothetical protein